MPLAESLRVAADRDPACRAVLEGLDERRAANMRRFAADLRATGELRPDLTDEQVAHLLWATNSAAFYRLATSGGRGPGDYAALVARRLDPHPARLSRPRHPVDGGASSRAPRPSPARHVRGYCGHLRDLTAITPHVRGR